MQQLTICSRSPRQGTWFGLTDVVRLKQAWDCFELGLPTSRNCQHLWQQCGGESRGWHDKREDSTMAEMRPTLVVDVAGLKPTEAGSPMRKMQRRGRHQQSNIGWAPSSNPSGFSCSVHQASAAAQRTPASVRELRSLTICTSVSAGSYWGSALSSSCMIEDDDDFYG